MSKSGWKDFHRRTAALRGQLADSAEKVAHEADVFAAILEQAAARGDAARRLDLARLERQISAIERRNADKLRHPGNGPIKLERLPALIEPAPGALADSKNGLRPGREGDT